MRVMPARVVWPNGRTISPALVDEHDGQVRVWAAVKDLGGPRRRVPAEDPKAVVLVAVVDGKLERNGSGWTAGELKVERGGKSCCGHPLSRYRPPRG